MAPRKHVRVVGRRWQNGVSDAEWLVAEKDEMPAWTRNVPIALQNAFLRQAKRLRLDLRQDRVVLPGFESHLPLEQQRSKAKERVELLRRNAERLVLFDGTKQVVPRTSTLLTALFGLNFGKHVDDETRHVLIQGHYLMQQEAEPTFLYLLRALDLMHFLHNEFTNELRLAKLMDTTRMLKTWLLRVLSQNANGGYASNEYVCDAEEELLDWLQDTDRALGQSARVRKRSATQHARYPRYTASTPSDEEHGGGSDSDSSDSSDDDIVLSRTTTPVTPQTRSRTESSSSSNNNPYQRITARIGITSMPRSAPRAAGATLTRAMRRQWSQTQLPPSHSTRSRNNGVSSVGSTVSSSRPSSVNYNNNNTTKNSSSIESHSKDTDSDAKTLLPVDPVAETARIVSQRRERRRKLLRVLSAAVAQLQAADAVTRALPLLHVADAESLAMHEDMRVRRYHVHCAIWHVKQLMKKPSSPVSTPSRWARALLSVVADTTVTHGVTDGVDATWDGATELQRGLLLAKLRVTLARFVDGFRPDVSAGSDGRSDQQSSDSDGALLWNTCLLKLLGLQAHMQCDNEPRVFDRRRIVVWRQKYAECNVSNASTDAEHPARVQHVASLLQGTAWRTQLVSRNALLRDLTRVHSQAYLRQFLQVLPWLRGAAAARRLLEAIDGAADDTDTVTATDTPTDDTTDSPTDSPTDILTDGPTETKDGTTDGTPADTEVVSSVDTLECDVICDDTLLDMLQGKVVDSLPTDKRARTDILAAQRTILNASGTVLQGIDDVCSDKVLRGFCLVRPPGHHVGVSRIGPDENGFCFFNNAGVGAAYALTHFADKIKKVTIVDFDAHHGDGTEECFHHSQSVQTVSIHLCAAEFFPRCPPFGTAAGGASLSDCSVNVPVPVQHCPTSDTLKGVGTAGKLNYETERNIVDPYASKYRDMARSGVRAVWMHKFVQQVLPAVRRFAPDLIMISAGFDAREGDALVDLQKGLRPADFFVMTRLLVQEADNLCHGRLLSVLEGGYGDRNIGACVAAHVRALVPLRRPGDTDPYEDEEEDEDEDDDDSKKDSTQLSVKRRRQRDQSHAAKRRKRQNHNRRRESARPAESVDNSNNNSDSDDDDASSTELEAAASKRRQKLRNRRQRS